MIVAMMQVSFSVERMDGRRVDTHYSAMPERNGAAVQAETM
jgi:hypothetical protein